MYPEDVIVLANGMVMAFDVNGKQLPDFQGTIAEVLPNIMKCTEYMFCKFSIGSWRKGVVECSREELNILADMLENIRIDVRQKG